MFDGPLIPELAGAERRARLRLARGPRIGPVTFCEALQHFGSAQAACAGLSVASEAAIAREEAALGRAGGRFLVMGDASYPAALAALPDAPPVLSAIGDLSLLGRRALAIVGAREASLAGRRFAAELAASLGNAGFTIVSGLARGIDAAAHEAALPTGTVAVLAGGIEQVYPPQNAGCSRPSPRAACCWRRRRSARRPSPAPSRAATASSAAWPPGSWWSRRRRAQAR
jgi:DNA processing protein